MRILLTVIPVILAITATILAFIFIVPEKRRAAMGKFGKFLHDTLNFKYLIVEKILQAFYIFATAFVILIGFFMLFYVQEGYDSLYYSSPDVWYGGYGLLTMILGPIVVRIFYEFFMMVILLIKNVIQINNKLKAGADDQSTVFSMPVANAPAPAVPKSVCPNCGKEVSPADAFCIDCGNPLR